MRASDFEFRYRIWAAAYLRSEVVHDERLHVERLVAEGPYRHVRNPLYLGTLLLTLGIAPLASLTGAVALVAGSTVFLLRLIGREEGELSAARGASYEAYLATVPRLVPSLRARLPSSGLRPRWGQALWGEVMMWGFAVGTLCLGLTLRFRLAVAIWLAGAALTAVQKVGRARTPPGRRTDDPGASPE